MFNSDIRADINLRDEMKPLPRMDLSRYSHSSVARSWWHISRTVCFIFLLGNEDGRGVRGFGINDSFWSHFVLRTVERSDIAGVRDGHHFCVGIQRRRVRGSKA